MRTRYYQVFKEKRDIKEITFEEYHLLPHKQRHIIIEPSNTLGDNLKEKYLRVDVRHPNGEWERTQ